MVIVIVLSNSEHLRTLYQIESLFKSAMINSTCFLSREKNFNVMQPHRKKLHISSATYQNNNFWF